MKVFNALCPLPASISEVPQGSIRGKLLIFVLLNDLPFQAAGVPMSPDKTSLTIRYLSSAQFLIKGQNNNAILSSEVSQGSILSPLLFLEHVDDLPSYVAGIVSHADDT